jgi:hypothetical protein
MTRRLIWKLLEPDTVELISPLPERECLQRLRDATDRELALLGRQRVVAWVGDHAFRLRRRGWNNPFQAFLEGETAADGSATSIRCRIGSQRFVFLGWGLGLAIVFAVLVEKLLDAIDDPATLGDAASPAGQFVVMAIGLMIGRWVARRDEGFLLDFVRQAASSNPADRQ